MLQQNVCIYRDPMTVEFPYNSYEAKETREKLNREH